MTQLKYVFLAIVAFLMVSCSDDTPTEPAPPTPMLTIEVLTPAPEVGQPVEFRATVTGVTLTAPVYEWDFGDGKDTLLTSADTAAATYWAEGTYTVRVSVTDTVANVDFRDSAYVAVVDNRPAWQRWTTVTFDLYATLRGYFGYTPRVLDHVHFTRTMGPVSWTTTGCTTGSGGGNIMASWYTGLRIVIAPPAARVDSLFFLDRYSTNNGMTNQHEYRKKEFIVHSINAISPVIEDSAVFRVEGVSTVDHIAVFLDSTSSSNSPTTIYNTIDTTADMYLEIRFYKK